MKNILLLMGLVSGLAGTASGATQAIVDGGFDFPVTSGWSLSGATIQDNPAYAHSSPGYLLLGNASSTTQTNYQTVTLPTNTIAASLSLYVNVYCSSQDPSSQLQVIVMDQKNFPHVLWAFNGANSPGGTAASPGPTNYVAYATDLSAFAGQTIQFGFVAAMSSSGSDTAFEIDDVSLVVATPADIPPNDAFTNAIPLSGEAINATDVNTYASKEPGEPNHAGNVGGHSVWWTWTAYTNGTVALDTAGSTFPTLLAVYTGSVVSNLTAVASNNAANNPDGYSLVEFPVFAGTKYDIAVDGYNGATGDVNLNLVFATETTRPSVRITSPASGAKVTNATVTVEGTASDKVAVTAVACRLENAAGTNGYQLATGTDKWSVTLSGLVPGLNTVRAVATNINGIASTPVGHTFTFAVPSPLTLAIDGAGAVSPTESTLDVGVNYTITAKAKTGFVFSNWVTQAGAVLATTPKLTFVMSTNLGLTANFVPNPFPPVQGAYAGLFYGDEVLHTNSGYFSGTLSSLGGLSAKLLLGGASYSLSGKFSAGGAYSNALVRHGESPLTVQLQLDFAGGLSGQISDGVWTANLAANRFVWSRTNAPAQAGEKYTLVLPNGGTEDQPGGYGFGSLSVDALGNLAFTGTLGDGTKVSQRTFLSSNGQWPLYLSLYSGKGSLLGWITNMADGTLAGVVNWQKLPQANSKPYFNGFVFANGLEASGALFSAVKGQPALNLTNGVLILEGGDLPSSLTTSLVLGDNNKATGTNKLSLTITPATGLFQGSLVNPWTGKTISISGALLQTNNAGLGVFLGTDQSGSVRIGEQ